MFTGGLKKDNGQNNTIQSLPLYMYVMSGREWIILLHLQSCQFESHLGDAIKESA